MGISAYSMIAMADGTSKRAEDMAEGDNVLRPASGGGLAVARVLNSPGVGMVWLADKNGNRLDATGDQTVLTENGFVQMYRIRPGTRLQTAEGLVVCSESAALPGDYMVYDYAAADEAPCMYANNFVIGIGKQRVRPQDS